MECMHPPPPPPPRPIYSLLQSSVFSRQQGLLGGAEAFFLSINQKLISTEISDKQTSQAEAEFVTCSKISQLKAQCYVKHK